MHRLEIFAIDLQSRFCLGIECIPSLLLLLSLLLNYVILSFSEGKRIMLGIVSHFFDSLHIKVLLRLRQLQFVLEILSH